MAKAEKKRDRSGETKPTDHEKKKWDCQNPKLTVMRKECGCMSMSICTVCGRVDKYPITHHRAKCKEFDVTP